MKQVGHPQRIHHKKIVILEHCEHTHIGADAHEQKKFSPGALRTVNEYPSEVINDDGEDENENVDRNEEHVEHTARNEQVQPAPFVREKKIEDGDYREEDEKCEGVKYHVVGSRMSLVVSEKLRGANIESGARY